MILRSFPENVEHGAPLRGDSFCSLSPKHGCFGGLIFKFRGFLRHVAQTGEADTPFGTRWKYPWLGRTLARARRTSSPTKMTWFGRQTLLRASRATRRTKNKKSMWEELDRILSWSYFEIIYVYMYIYIYVYMCICVYMYIYICLHCTPGNVPKFP